MVMKHPQAPEPMPAPAAIPRRNGFSLVELMVVLFVMGLLATVVVLAMPGDSRTLRDTAQRFAARTSAARDEAIVTSAPVSLVVSSAGYYFEHRADGRWLPFAEAKFAQASWGEGTSASIVQQGGAEGGRSRIVFDTVGLASSDAAVRLSRGGNDMTVHIARDGKVKLDAP